MRIMLGLMSCVHFYERLLFQVRLECAFIVYNCTSKWRALNDVEVDKNKHSKEQTLLRQAWESLWHAMPS